MSLKNRERLVVLLALAALAVAGGSIWLFSVDQNLQAELLILAVVGLAVTSAILSFFNSREVSREEVAYSAALAERYSHQKEEND